MWGEDSKCLEFVAAGWCIGKISSRDLACDGLEIPLVVIRLGVSGLKKTRVMCLLDLLGELEKGWRDLLCVEHL